MRQASVIKELNPCDNDYTDESLQTISDAKTRGPVYCDNVEKCQKTGIYCCRKAAQQMAEYILNSKKSFWQAVEQEKKDFLKMGSEGKYWVFRDGKWQIVEGKKNAIEDIVKFALIMIDRKEGERRPFSKDGKRIPETSPEDARDNAVLDIIDCTKEVTG
jgi:hypothetical protein